MASPEVERPPLTSPSHHVARGYPRTQPHLNTSGDKRKSLNFRYNRYLKQTKQQCTGSTSQQSTSFSRRASSGTTSSSNNFPVRKRSYSFSAEGHCKSVTSVTPAKRWKRSKDAKKFLLGGNIRDPLNLSSLSDEKVSKEANAVTPEYSPIPTPKHRKAEYKIEVLIPKNISDPLNLMQDDNDEDYDASFNKKKSRPRKRIHNHRRGGESPKGTEVKKVRFEEQNSSFEEIKETDLPKVETGHKPAVEEVVKVSEDDVKIEQKTQVTTKQEKVQKQPKFQYGNYSRYYGYRLEGSDPRLSFFNPNWFADNDVLDIGCNVGEVTMAIARDMWPKSILGIDIDPSLISKARKMVNQYANRKVPSAMATPNPEVEPVTRKEQLFPQSLPMIFGPLDPTQPTPTMPQQPQVQLTPTMHNTSLFPHNIKFLCDNYVLEEDELLEFAQPEFDTILCLSTTKWIHLNFGDDGLKRAFKRMFAQLRQKGMLIIEPQALASYSKKAKKINQVTKDNFKNMKLMPNQFVEYLLNEVGFTGGEVIAVPEHSALGFRRPIHVFKKP